MQIAFSGPGSNFELLFETHGPAGKGLPPQLQQIFGGDWQLPAPVDERPYTYMNFVVSRDGRTSFGEPGREGGGEISRRLAHDRWCMALLRARADAILVGAGTLRVEPRHRWTHHSLWPADADAFDALRQLEARRANPLLVLLTRSGQLDPQARVLREPDEQTLIATTRDGAEQARQILNPHPRLDYHVSPGAEVDLPLLLRNLREQYGVQTLLCEGGPLVYAALLQQHLVDEEFLTLSPIMVGSAAEGAPARPALVEGVSFSPDQPPQSSLLTVRRVGSYLFLRSRYTNETTH